VMLADIEADALAAAVDGLGGTGAAVRGVTCDVTSPASLEQAAAATLDAFGKVHVLCNNAGVGGGSSIDAISVETWRWVLDVNLMGVVHGVRAFLPHLRAHGEGGHIVNTASMAGIISGFGLSPYTASKFAVVAMSEGLAVDVAPFGIGVSVLCPGFVRTRIGESQRNRPQRYGPAQIPAPGSPGSAIAAEVIARVQSGMDPDAVASQVLRAMQEDRLYVFTHPGFRAETEQRFATILRAMETSTSP